MSKLNKTLVIIASIVYTGLTFAGSLPNAPISAGQGSSVGTDTYTVQGNDGTHVITQPLTQFELDCLKIQQEYAQANYAAGRIRIDIYTSSTCPHCHDLLAHLQNPGVQDIIQERGIKIVTHIDENPGGLLGYPTSRISKGGRQVGEFLGDKSVDELVSILKNA